MYEMNVQNNGMCKICVKNNDMCKVSAKNPNSMCKNFTHTIGVFFH
jgi:hypothetical protein